MPTLPRWPILLGRRPLPMARPYTALAGLFLAALAIPFIGRDLSEWDQVFVCASQNLLAGQSLEANGTGYVYPPFAAWLAIPFTRLSPLAGRLLFFLINAVCLVLAVRWAWRLAGGPSERQMTGRDHLVAALGFACGAGSLANCLAHLQVDVMVAALLLGGCWLLASGGSMSAACLFGAAAAFKCTPLLWAPYLAYRRQWLAALAVPAVAIGLNLLPNLAGPAPEGGAWLTRWCSRILLPSTQSYPGVWASDPVYNQSINGGLYRLLVVDPPVSLSASPPLRPDPPSPQEVKAVAYGLQLTLVLLVGIVTLASRRRWQAGDSMNLALECSLVLLLMLLLSPMSSKAHFGTMILPGFCLARLWLVHRDRVLGFCLFATLALTLIGHRDLIGKPIAYWMMWHGNLTWSTLLLLVGCLYALGRGLNVNAGSHLLVGSSAFRRSWGGSA